MVDRKSLFRLRPLTSRRPPVKRQQPVIATKMSSNRPTTTDTFTDGESTKMEVGKAEDLRTQSLSPELALSATSPETSASASGSYKDIEQYSKSGVSNERGAMDSDEKNREPSDFKQEPEVNPEKVKNGETPIQLNDQMKEAVQIQEKNADQKKMTAFSKAHSEATPSLSPEFVLPATSTETPSSVSEPDFNGATPIQMKDAKEEVQMQENRALYSQQQEKIVISDAHRESKLPMNVVTLAGENRGASMETSYSSHRDKSVRIHRFYKIFPYDASDEEEDNETSSKSSSSKHGEAGECKEHPAEAYVNSNAQGVNNSILFNVSVAERNPGVRMVVTHIPGEFVSSGNGKRFSQRLKSGIGMETEKPLVRRRCLRGLFMDSSDSDGKPRRHGCGVGCKKRDETKT